jgi:ubiquinone/menaquinone biosynthesis C-methylase UbiE
MLRVHMMKTKKIKYAPYPAPGGLQVLDKTTANRRGQNDKADLPVPPEYLWEGYGKTAEIYLGSGKEHTEKMMGVLNSAGVSIDKTNRILDFGCASGRMIRWLADFAEEREIWGVDLNAHHIVWCQDNLNPPFNFATVTTQPHLPFEDRYFDLIYCGSVFTHIDDLAEAWLLEIKRIMRPGGNLYVTIHDKHTADLIINHIDQVPYAKEFREFLLSYDRRINFQASTYYKFSIDPGGPESQVFYDIDYLRRLWGRILKIKSITPEAYGYQTALLLEK